jgi:hypothetical protein
VKVVVQLSRTIAAQYLTRFAVIMALVPLAMADAIHAARKDAIKTSESHLYYCLPEKHHLFRK